MEYLRKVDAHVTNVHTNLGHGNSVWSQMLYGLNSGGLLHARKIRQYGHVAVVAWRKALATLVGGGGSGGGGQLGHGRLDRIQLVAGLVARQQRPIGRPAARVSQPHRV